MRHTQHLIPGEFLGASVVEVGPGLQSPLVHPLVLGPALTRFHLRNSSCCKHGGVQRTFVCIGVSVDKVFIY